MPPFGTEDALFLRRLAASASDEAVASRLVKLADSLLIGVGMILGLAENRS